MDWDEAVRLHSLTLTTVCQDHISKCIFSFNSEGINLAMKDILPLLLIVTYLKSGPAHLPSTSSP